MSPAQKRCDCNSIFMKPSLRLALLWAAPTKSSFRRVKGPLFTVLLLWCLSFSAVIHCSKSVNRSTALPFNSSASSENCPYRTDVRRHSSHLFVGYLSCVRRTGTGASTPLLAYPPTVLTGVELEWETSGKPHARTTWRGSRRSWIEGSVPMPLAG